MLNILIGDQNQENHKDWNGDKQITDPGDGYGFLLNGDQLGYIRAVYSHADYAVNAFGASRNIIVNGENAMVCTQNLATWAPQLRDELVSILNAAALSDMDTAIQRTAELADQILNGIDSNENGSVEAIPGECGVVAVYQAVYRMADMPLLPVNPLDTPTPTAGPGTPSATPARTLVASPTPRENGPSTNVPTSVSTNPPTSQPPNPPTHGPPPQPTRGQRTITARITIPEHAKGSGRGTHSPLSSFR
jgi:hypothetical protein